MSAAADARAHASLAAIVERRLGLAMGDRLDAVGAALRARASIRRVSEAVYVERHAEEPSELRALATELTVGETYFFRHPEQLDALAMIASELSPTRTVRVLSAGCASGEEAYTVAILLRERLGAACAIEVLGLDLNPSAIERANAGVYSRWALRNTSPATLSAWFRATDRGQHAIAVDRLPPVRFEVANLAEPSVPALTSASFDLVLCRNMLMYLSPAATRTAVAHLTRALASDGHLFLGHAESVRGLTHDLRLVHAHGAFFYRRGEGARADAHAADPDWHLAVERGAERVRGLAARPVSARASSAERRAPAPSSDTMELMRRERFREALEALRPVEVEAEDEVALLLRATLLFHAQQTTQAEALAERLVAGGALDAGAHYLLALCREARGDVDGAMEQDRLASHLDPSFAMPRLHLGICARRQRMRDLALAELSAALELLASEEAARIILFGGGLGRDVLIALCRAEIQACGVGA